MDSGDLWILFGCTTFVAAALCVLLASRPWRYAIPLGIAAAAVLDLVYLLGAFRLAPPGAVGHYEMVGPLLLVATFAPAWMWLAGWRWSSWWVRIAAAASAVLLWAVTATYLGLFVGCTLDVHCP